MTGADDALFDGNVVYVADADGFDPLVTGQSTTDSFTYVMRDSAGETSSASVSVTITGAENGTTQIGFIGNDSLTGSTLDEKLDGAGGNDTLDAGAGADTLVGGVGNDLILAGSGRDSVSAGDGNDTISGGGGDDVLVGARGADVFTFGPSFGSDIVGDFRAGEDDIRFEGVAGLGSYDLVMARAVQSGTNVIITDLSGDILQLNNVNKASLTAGDFLFV